MATYETSRITREALISAAGQLAAVRGFASVTVRAIARQAGVNAGTIHYHFGGKEQLFATVVRTVMQVWKEHPLEELIGSHDIDTPEGQAKVIRAIVRRNIRLLFNRDLPDWHCRVIFQVMRNRGPLREILKKELIDPSHTALKKLFRRINPAMNEEETFLRILVMNAPVFFHADRMDFILADLKIKGYGEKYLQKMEDIIVLQTQLGFGLPTR
jgi:AcrR family transcriptional regulator